MSNHALLQLVYSEHRATNYGLSYPIQGDSDSRLSYLGFDIPLTLEPFLFVPSVRLFVSLGVANSTIGIPRLLPLYAGYAAGLSPIKSGFCIVSRFLVGRFSRLCFTVETPH